MALRTVSDQQMIARLRVDNPWWGSGQVPDFYRSLHPRLYFNELFGLIRQKKPHRAVVVMGPRRVGKTVLLFHTVQRLIEGGTDPKRIMYLSLDTPVYGAADLDHLFRLCRRANGLVDADSTYYVFYDEVQYLKDWEVHLKSLVDTYHRVQFVASGSAAAALKLKSQESGAGRFTDFSLPPLTFHEFIHLRELNYLIQPRQDEWRGKQFTSYDTINIEELNEHFIAYINFGGYPEVSLSKDIQQDPARYLKSDIIDKVLQRDLPTLYGIQDVLELNRLFTTIAFNTGSEFTYETLAMTSGVSKNTIKKYIHYLEAAFLLKIVHRIDAGGKKFKRATHFKIYLTNPSLRSGLFAPVSAGAENLGSLVETAIFSQWFHRAHFTTYYARWQGGEVDIVGLNKEQRKPSWAVEIKWSDHFARQPQKLKSLRAFASLNALKQVVVTSKTITETVELEGLTVKFAPAALYCYTVGRRSVEGEG